MSTPSPDPSIEHEPHLRAHDSQPDRSEGRARATLQAEQSRSHEADAVDNTVWDEPVMSGQRTSDLPAGEVTYARWLEKKIAATSCLTSWLMTMGIVLLAGPWGVLGALFQGFQWNGQVGLGGLVAVTIIGPVTEEITKIAVALWIIEKRPYLFKSIGQILICAAAGGLAFSVIENLMYLHLYIPDHSPALAEWRWRVCTGLHLTCSFVAGVGLARIWYNAVSRLHRPQLGLGMPWFFIAMVGHGLYNFAAFVSEQMGWMPF